MLLVTRAAEYSSSCLPTPIEQLLILKLTGATTAIGSQCNLRQQTYDLSDLQKNTSLLKARLVVLA